MATVRRNWTGTVCTGGYLLLLGLTLPMSASALTPMVTLQADVGTLFLQEGTLKIAVSGFYIRDRLSVDIDISFEGKRKCTGDELKRQCESTSYSYGYQDVREILGALDAATTALQSGSALQQRFKMDAAPDCNPMWAEVTVATHGTLAQFVLAEGASTYPVTTDIDQLAAFRLSLQRASDLRDHMRPQIEAFNRAAPDRSKPIEDVPDVNIRASGVKLTFSGIAGSRYAFVLENNSKREISFRATEQSPVDTGMSCRSAGQSTPDLPELALVDGSFRFVTLAPGKTSRFTVDNHDLFDARPYAKRYPGGLCRMRLELQNMEEVESTEFTP